MKQARRSVSSIPYNCQKPWPENCFVQCGGGGIVLQNTSMEEAFENLEETLKTLAGSGNQKHYRTAFFEAFPRDPDTFIRGEGADIEEAEAKAYEKYLKILNCKGHEFDRRGRTDGYAFCIHCNLSGSFLDPTTVCKDCGIPTTGFKNSKENNLCTHHYFTKNIEELDLIKDNEEYVFYFRENKKFYNLFLEKGIVLSDKKWRLVSDIIIDLSTPINLKYRPLFGKILKTEQEVHELILKEIDLRFPEIYEKTKGLLNK